MTVAIVLAGGSGQRMHLEIPKQFVHVNNKPIIIYTLEAFQNHPQVDKILAVCRPGWQDHLRAYARQAGISKLEWVTDGGETGQESIRNGVFFLREHCQADDIVIIHDGIRPIVEDEVLSDVIVKCSVYGNAVTSLPYNEQIFVSADNVTTDQYIPRDQLRKVATPQAYRFDKLDWAYTKAFEEQIGIGPSTYTNTLMVDLGETLHLAIGSEKNIKLTTQDDLEMFEALIRNRK